MKKNTFKNLSGGVTKAKGFLSSGVWCGIKRSQRPDLGLIYSPKPCVGAAVFTKNSVIAAPLIVSKRNARDNKFQAIVVNSGNANCFTGKEGLKYAEQTADLFGELLNISKSDVIVASTGIIGKAFPYKKIASASSDLVNELSRSGAQETAKSILTTDLKTKEIAVQFTIDGKKITIGGCAKGSGMIAPNMATMLGFITTDVSISSKMLKLALQKANDVSFNCITVDGCMSTNDMVTVMANGEAENAKINAPGKNFDLFTEALTFVCMDLAKKIVLDGEGATKFIEIKVSGAKTEAQAKTIGLTIANSMLVKTAAFGKNPNWGRVAAAVGSLGIKGIDEDHLKIDFSSFKKKEIAINVHLSLGKAQQTVFTCDLSYEYIRINGDYN